MDRIALNRIEAFGHHGVHAHERERGQRFIVDVVLEVDLAAAGASDRLENTVDYGVLAAGVESIVAGEPCNLVETVAERIADRCLEHGLVQAVEITVTKPNAPLPVVARGVSVTVRRPRPA